MSQQRKKQKVEKKKQSALVVSNTPMLVADATPLVISNAQIQAALVSRSPEAKQFGPMNVLATKLTPAIYGGAAHVPANPADPLDTLNLFVTNWCNRRNGAEPFMWTGGHVPQFKVIDTLLVPQNGYTGYWDCRQEIADCLAGQPKSMASWWLGQMLRDIIREIYEVEGAPIPVDEEDAEGNTVILPRFIGPPSNRVCLGAAQFLAIFPTGVPRTADIEFLRRVIRGEEKELDVERLWKLFVEQRLAPPDLLRDWADFLRQDYADHKDGKRRPDEWKDRKAELSPAAKYVADVNFEGSLVRYLQYYYPRGFTRVCVLSPQEANYVGDAWQWHPAVKSTIGQLMLSQMEIRRGRDVIPIRELPLVSVMNINMFVGGKQQCVKLFKDS